VFYGSCSMFDLGLQLLAGTKTLYQVSERLCWLLYPYTRVTCLRMLQTPGSSICSLFLKESVIFSWLFINLEYGII